MIFVFPLPKVVLFPSTSQPLNIFEPRYVEMINDAVERNIEVALVQIEPSGGETAGQGVLGHIRSVAGCGPVQLLERRPDGTMLILLKGARKVRLDSAVTTDKPYIIAEETTLEEGAELEAGNKFYLHRLMKELSSWLERNIALPKRRDEFISNMVTDEERVNTCCSLLIEDPDWQQQLLEIDDLNTRLKTATALLETDAASH
jgi:uncharacterized protein